MGKMLRSITFPCIMNAIALDPGEHVCYGGGRDGKIYVAALTADCTSTGNYEKHIISCMSDHRLLLPLFCRCINFHTMLW